MLSTGAFNALLKTLEEPPEHVKFILATTEIQKVPATIQSRCQRFNFRNIGPDEIAKRLGEITKDEGAKPDARVMARIARLANGSMRDALSILDQLLSVSPKKVTAEVLDEIIPPAQDEQVLELLTHAAEGDAAAVMKDVDTILGAGRGLEVFCNDMIAVVRVLLHVRACGIDTPTADVPAAARDEYAKLADQFELSHYVQMIAMLEELRRNVRFSSAGRALTDALMLRLSRMREWASIEQLLGQLPAESAAVEKKKPRPTAPPPAAAASVANTSVAAAPRGGRQSEPRAQATGPNGPPPRGDRGTDLSDGPPTDDLPPDHYADIPEAVGRATDIEKKQATIANDALPAIRTVPVTAEQKEVILKDPLVQQTLELFDGVVVNIQRRVPTAAPESDEPSE